MCTVRLFARSLMLFDRFPKCPWACHLKLTGPILGLETPSSLLLLLIWCEVPDIFIDGSGYSCLLTSTCQRLSNLHHIICTGCVSTYDVLECFWPKVALSEQTLGGREQMRIVLFPNSDTLAPRNYRPYVVWTSLRQPLFLDRHLSAHFVWSWHVCSHE